MIIIGLLLTVPTDTLKSSVLCCFVCVYVHLCVCVCVCARVCSVSIMCVCVCVFLSMVCVCVRGEEEGMGWRRDTKFYLKAPLSILKSQFIEKGFKNTKPFAHSVVLLLFLLILF